MPCAVIPQTTLTHCSTKTSTFAPFVVEIYVYNSFFTCSCTAVARAHTQLPHDNRHWTCKRLPPDSIWDSIRIRIVAACSIRYSIRTEISDSQVNSIRVQNQTDFLCQLIKCYLFSIPISAFCLPLQRGWMNVNWTNFPFSLRNLRQSGTCQHTDNANELCTEAPGMTVIRIVYHKWE